MKRVHFVALALFLAGNIIACPTKMASGLLENEEICVKDLHKLR